LEEYGVGKDEKNRHGRGSGPTERCPKKKTKFLEKTFRGGGTHVNRKKKVWKNQVSQKGPPITHRRRKQIAKIDGLQPRGGEDTTERWTRLLRKKRKRTRGTLPTSSGVKGAGGRGVLTEKTRRGTRLREQIKALRKEKKPRRRVKKPP